MRIISRLNDQIEKGELSLDGVNLVSLDVNKMYNNISEDLGKSACEKYLQSRPVTSIQSANQETDSFVTTVSLMKGLDLCLKNNYFCYDGKVYRQTGGVGTGSKMAPPYACIAMGDYEERVFNSENDMLDLVLLLKRLIHDIQRLKNEWELFL